MRSLAPTKAGRGAAGWWPTSPSSRWAGGVLHPRAGHRPRTVSVRPRRVPRPVVRRRRRPAWGCRAKHRRRGSRPCSRAATPTPASSSAAPTAATPCRPSTWSCGRPRASRSSTAWATRRPAGRCWPPITLGRPRRSAYLDDHLGARRGHGGVQHVSGQGLLAVGFDHRTSREGDPLLHTHLVVANRVQGRTDAGRPWTAGTCTGIGWPRTPSTGPPTSGSCPDTRGGVDGGRPPRQPGAPGPARGPGPAVLQAHRPDRPGGGAAGGRRAGADTAAGQVGRPGHPQAQGAGDTGHPVWTLADRRRPSAAWTRTPWSGR